MPANHVDKDVHQSENRFIESPYPAHAGHNVLEVDSDGFADCVDSDGRTYRIDEDGLTIGTAGFGAKAYARRAADRSRQAQVIAESEIKQRREIRQKHAGLRERAKELSSHGLVSFADLKPYGMTKTEASAAQKMGSTVPMGPENTEVNLYRLFDALFVGGRIDEVHYDTSRRMLVDENGALVDDAWAVRDLMDAGRSVLFKGVTSEQMVKALRAWALDYKFNDISERVKARLAHVAWDEEERLETFLITTFKCADTADNRLFSKYWCLSLYNRVMHPGCRAPIAMALFGPQDAGKSYFQKVICEELLFNPNADVVTFDPERRPLDLFRDIYGISIIAAIPEMTNFGKIGVNKMKAFMTGTTDTFDQKFGFSGAWPRQFIVIMDGNRYEGLWRDNDDVDANGESQGERRFYPVFAFEIPDSTGPVRWRAEQGLKLDALKSGGAALREELWQVMKECEDFMDHFGERGYNKVVDDATAMVKRFSKKEKDADQGTVRDKTFDENFPSALYRTIKNRGVIGTVNVGSEKVRGLRVLTKDIQAAYADMTRKEISPQQVSKKMRPTGAKKGVAGRDSMKVTAFVFDHPEFAKLDDGADDRDAFVETFVRLFVSDEPVSENEGKSESEVGREGF